MRRVRRFAVRLARDTRGLALLEFAFSVPILLLLSLTGAELLNYTTTRMRVSQMALQIADNAARMGKGTQITAKVISETDINDLFTGAQLQSGELNLNANGRVILSDVEPVANPNTTGKYKIAWQRCYGSKTTHSSSYGSSGDTDLAGVGPANQQITAQDDNATMFVEVYYVYTPIIALSRAPSTTMIEVASMAVRDRRDLTQIYNTENAPIATC
ncbi:MAG: hypothetical protein JWN21_1080 [Sphingomonas bacterium]|uniref:TadE/TadG family type IV pilus assembly protein n=1 Tax=Sphingomonas bacterium TaxID=1895847 RepID=UPI002603CFB5|nr:pilus assembly protein [Sphingomonas bacterium]MDB5695537.1 hypothetical protein [Sphingomonas bacterium]